MFLERNKILFSLFKQFKHLNLLTLFNGIYIFIKNDKNVQD